MVIAPPATVAFALLKGKEHREALSRRMCAWEASDIDGLLREGRVLQQHTTRSTPHHRDESLASSFSKMFAGKTRTALQLLTKEGRGTMLPLDQPSDPSNPSAGTVLDALKAKHPSPQPINNQALSTAPDQVAETHPVLFDSITASTFHSATVAWRRICTTFKTASTEMCHALALLARCICMHPTCRPRGIIYLHSLSPHSTDKSPGVRPIGVAEVARRIVGKAVLSVTGTDVKRAAGAIQLCAGQEAGCEAAIHAMRRIFSDDGNEGVLLVDASNAFNQLNRKVALHNVTTVCSTIATALINTYRRDAELFVDSETLYSREGTTQGDPWL